MTLRQELRALERDVRFLKWMLTFTVGASALKTDGGRWKMAYQIDRNYTVHVATTYAGTPTAVVPTLLPAAVADVEADGTATNGFTITPKALGYFVVTIDYEDDSVPAVATFSGEVIGSEGHMAPAIHYRADPFNPPAVSADNGGVSFVVGTPALK